MLRAPEAEAAIRDMRGRFLAVSDEIARELGWLASSIASAPADVRAAVLAAAEQIASTQQHLMAAANRLPARPEQRLALMQGVLQRQQGALRQLASIIQQHKPSGSHAPTVAARVDAAPAFSAPVGPPHPSRSVMETVAPGDGASYRGGVAHDPRAAAYAPQFFPAEAGQDGGGDAATSEALVHGELPELPDDPAEQGYGYDEDLDDLDDAPMPDDAPAELADDPARGSHARSLRERLRERAHIAAAGAGSRWLALVGVVLMGCFFGYLMLSRASEAPDAGARPPVTARRIDAAGIRTAGVSSGRPGLPSRLESSPLPTPPSPPPIARIEGPELTTAAADAAPAPLPDRSAPPLPPGVIVMMPAGPAPSRAPAPPSPQAEKPREKAASNQDRAPIETGSTATPAEVRHDRFVPVVFTHKEHATAMRAFADLQRQYPALLTRRTGEAQPVDLGDKGVWHRLVVLPPGPRPQAKKLCDQFMAAGYDRCWVKAY